MDKKVIRKLRKMSACNNAVDFVKKHKTKQGAWNAYERGSDMLWLLGKLSGPPKSAGRKKLVLVACKCARLSLKHVKTGEIRPRKAIETAEAWARNKKGVSLQDVRNAADAAYAAAAAYADAAYAAAYAADAAYADAAYAAAAAAYAAYAAYADAADADAAAAADAKIKILKKCADIVRKYYPKVPRF